MEMKVLFEDEQRNTALMIGSYPDNELIITSIRSENESEFKALSSINLNLEQAYELSSILSKFISKMEEEHRKKLPLWKRLF